MFELTTQTLYQNVVQTPLGQIYLAGVLDKSIGRQFERKRVFGRYAFVYLLEGCGTYSDANGYMRDVGKGDLILLFPELEHSYGPGPRDRWCEIFVVFDGPLFDLCRTSGLMSSADPIAHLEPVEEWSQKLGALLCGNPVVADDVVAAKAQDACDLVALLARMLGGRLSGPEPGALDPLMSRAGELLSANLGIPVDLEDLALSLGLSYETFRKRFQRTLGVPPARYRLHKRLEAGAALLQHTRLTHQEIAETLGFSDSFHFGREFKKFTGKAPGEYRGEKTF